MKILVIGGLPSSLYNFRGEFIKELLRNNHTVLCMASGATLEDIQQINKIGVRYLDYPLSRNGLNPFGDFKTLIFLYNKIKVEKPDLIVCYTIKPVIWGGIAAKLAGKSRYYALITGLGFAFQRRGFLRNLLTDLVRHLYEFALSKASFVIFQNIENQQVFIDYGIVPKERTARVFGSGVNVSRYENLPLPEGTPVFLTIARLLGEKGLREYAKAAEIVKLKYPEANFRLVGPEDPSPDGIPLNEVMKWHKSGTIEYMGGTNDVRPFINDCHVFVLASYHEGMPRTVLEAMSIGRPILTTNVEGCRETVIEGVNGFLVPKQDAQALAVRMIWFIENQTKWYEMAKQSRKIAEDIFDVHKVNESLLKIMQLKESNNA